MGATTKHSRPLPNREEEAAPPSPIYTLTAPRPAVTPHPARRSPHGAGTLRKAKRTYIWRAVRRAGAAPVRSAPLSVAAVLLGRPPPAAAGRGRRPAPAGPLAARLPPVISVLGAQPGGWGVGRGRGGQPAWDRPLCERNRCPFPCLSLAFREQGPGPPIASTSKSRGRKLFLPHLQGGGHLHPPGRLPPTNCSSAHQPLPQPLGGFDLQLPTPQQS